MDFPFENCIVANERFSSSQARESLQYQHDMAYILLDLGKLGEATAAANYLCRREHEYLGRFASDKRKKEWLGGRFAAKYAAARVLLQSNNPLDWSNLAVIPDEKGRPFLAAEKKVVALPDISISHSGGLAAAMAVSKGLCGIDIQQVTERVDRVRERFCTPGDERILGSFFSVTYAQSTPVLTKLWAAKEALRKVADSIPLPGFMELELREIIAGSAGKGSAILKFVFTWRHNGLHGKPCTEKSSVAVDLIADYALALTARNDTVA